jgi:hypothetical protein
MGLIASAGLVSASSRWRTSQPSPRSRLTMQGTGRERAHPRTSHAATPGTRINTFTVDYTVSTLSMRKRQVDG